MITMVGVGVERPGSGKMDVTVQSNLYKGFEAVTNVIFAYSGISPCFFTIFVPLNPSTNNEPRPRRILLLHLRTPHPGNLPQSHLPPPRRRHIHVLDRCNCHLLLRRRRRRVPSSRLHFPPGAKNSLRGRYSNHRDSRYVYSQARSFHSKQLFDFHDIVLPAERSRHSLQTV